MTERDATQERDAAGERDAGDEKDWQQGTGRIEPAAERRQTEIRTIERGRPQRFRLLQIIRTNNREIVKSYL